MKHVQIAPSMMCADLWRLDLSVAALEEGGVDLLHFDLMDAHFVPNMPLGPVSYTHLTLPTSDLV